MLFFVVVKGVCAILIFSTVDAKEANRLCSTVFRRLIQQGPQRWIISGRECGPVGVDGQRHNANTIIGFGAVDDVNIEDGAGVSDGPAIAHCLDQSSDVEELLAGKPRTISDRRGRLRVNVTTIPAVQQRTELCTTNTHNDLDGGVDELLLGIVDEGDFLPVSYTHLTLPTKRIE